MLLASLHFVDGVVLFDEDTPQELIKAVRPSILVKGSDYSPETIVGRISLKSYGESTNHRLFTRIFYFLHWGKDQSREK